MSRQDVIRLFKNYSSIVPEVKYEIKYGEGIKILTNSPKNANSSCTSKSRNHI